MISFRLGKQSHVYKLVKTVVICFQILTFAVSATAFFGVPPAKLML